MSDDKNYVVLLHGLASRKFFMFRISRRLRKNNFIPINIDYPSRKFAIEQLAVYCFQQIAKQIDIKNSVISFVTHSLGGVIVRVISQQHPELKIGKVVMLAPPNHGSVLADAFSKNKLMRKFFGQVLIQLSTKPDSFINQLPLPNFTFGVIAGSIKHGAENSDGIVTAASAQLPNMSDFTIVKSAHVFIVFNSQAIVEVLNFLQYGKFTTSHKNLRVH